MTVDLTKTSVRHGDEILRRLPTDMDLQGVEVGVLRGRLSAHLLGNRPRLRLAMVDHWKALGRASVAYNWAVDHDEPCGMQSIGEVEGNRQAANAVERKYAGRAHIMWASSVMASAAIRRHSQDFVFIDADHRKESVLSDVRLWLHNLRPGGWIGGHDYLTPRMGAEVAEAVDLLVNKGVLRDLELGEFYTWFARSGEDHT